MPFETAITIKEAIGGCKVIGCWCCFDTVVNSSLASTALGF